MDLTKKISDAVDEFAGWLKELSLFIHSNPETGYKEEQAAAAIIDFLKERGFDIETGVADLETAFIARHGKGGGPKIAVLAEYDALPGLGHGCGHNLIAGSAVGAAAALKKAFPDLKGEIRCIGTPAEEGGGGKIQMAAKGIFDDLDAAMLCHPSNVTEVFKLALGVVTVKIKFLGKSAHAAAWPERGINALDAMVLFFSGVNAMRQQFPRYARVHGIITYGGDAPNIIPELTEATFLVRALSRKVLDKMLDTVRSIAEGAATSTGCKVEWDADMKNAYAPFDPNRALGKVFWSSLEELGVKIEQHREDEGMGSSDIGNVGERCPTIHPEFRIGPNDVVHHTVEFRDQAKTDTAIKAMLDAAKAMALTAAKIYENPSLATDMRKEFEAAKK